MQASYAIWKVWLYSWNVSLKLQPNNFSLSLLLVLFLWVSYSKQAISISSTMRPALRIKPPDCAHHGACILPCPGIAWSEYEKGGRRGWWERKRGFARGTSEIAPLGNSVWAGWMRQGDDRYMGLCHSLCLFIPKDFSDGFLGHHNWHCTCIVTSSTVDTPF